MRPAPSAARCRFALVFSAVTIVLAFAVAVAGVTFVVPDGELGASEAQQALAEFVNAAAAGDVRTMNEAVSDISPLKDDEAALAGVSSRLRSAIGRGSAMPVPLEVGTVEFEVSTADGTQKIALTGFVSGSGNRLPYRAELSAERGRWKLVTVELP